jgi:hypothetical protein
MPRLYIVSFPPFFSISFFQWHSTAIPLSQLYTVAKYQYGLAAVIAQVLLFLTTLDYVRRHYFNVFLLSHIVLFIAVFACVYLHTTTTFRPYLFVICALYGLDLCCRWYRGAFTSSKWTWLASILVLPNYAYNIDRFFSFSKRKLNLINFLLFLCYHQAPFLL